MTKITKEELLSLSNENAFLEANLAYLELQGINPYQLNITLIIGCYKDDYLFKFKNAEIYLPRIRTDLSGIVFDKEGNLVFCGWGGMEGDNQKIIFFNEPDYKTEMEIYKLTEEESKQYYYV
jgi:hypothetical protein